MGPEIAMALMAGGTGAQMLGAQQQRREQQGFINRAMDRNNAATRQGTADVLQNAETQQGGVAQLGAVQKAQDDTAARTMADLKGAGADLIDTAGGNGAQSQAFLSAKADKALAEGNRMTAIARETAKVRTPGMVQNDMALSRGDLAERMASAQASNRARSQAAQLDASAVETPFYGQLGQLASLVGAAGMMMPAGGAAALAGDAATAGFGGAEYGMADALGSGAAPTMGGMSKLAAALPMFGARRGPWAGR